MIISKNNAPTVKRMNIFQKEFIFPPGSAECHASTLCTLPDGGFLAAWFQGAKEGTDDTAIFGARRFSEDGGWGTPFLLAKISDEAHWNPVLFRHGNKITLFFKVGKTIADWKTFVIHSEDSGISWTVPKELVPDDVSGGRGPVKNPPLITSQGWILAPASVERGTWNAFVDISTDGGRHWRKTAFIPLSTAHVDDPWRENTLAAIQPTLWESSSGIHMFLRTNNNLIYRSDSIDGGLTWSEAYQTSLPNNNSGICVSRLETGELALACNPYGCITPENWGNRHELTLLLSCDDGASWSKKIELENEPPGEYMPNLPREFSYPTVIAVGRGKFVLTYTWNRRSIVFASANFRYA